VKNIISFSGGKDSTALILWAIENLKEFDTVFCDTGWEHPITYEYIQYINEKLLDAKLNIIKSKKYNGFYDMCIKKKRVPSTMARFCTEALKIKPMQEFVKQFLPDTEIYVGIRANESYSRSKLPMKAYADIYNCDIVRPLLHWTAQDCFDIMKRHNIKPNPLYKMGMKRVGCMPCVMVSHKEMKSIYDRFPEIANNIQKLENELGSTFFPPNYIPDAFCSRFIIQRKPIYKDDDLDIDEIIGYKNVRKYYPTADDVKKYLCGNNQDGLFPEPEGETCMSYYSICE
jgi:3'-phosphoadenosine 5'-phosphosulfate sulfotransferase (PAPS reductase)/FAD synthetase